jgi:hypothetical protein
MNLLKAKVVTVITIALMVFTILPLGNVSASGNIKICMIDYSGHDDTILNADMTAIQSSLPDILIDNTAHGLWGIDGGNGGNCDAIPALYTTLGIHVYSYITSGYEGQEYGGQIDSLDANLARIDGISEDGATGVFMDEVTEFPTNEQIQYLNAIYDQCKLDGLKLIINTGYGDFNYSILSKVCDYVMTDETYVGTNPTSSEKNIGLNRCIVVNNACASVDDAIWYTETAWDNGFGWSWNSDSYQYNLPSYLSGYISGLYGYAVPTVTTEATPTITPPITPPILKLSVVSNKTSNSVRLNGIITATGGENPSVLVCWDIKDDQRESWANEAVPSSPPQPQNASSFYLDITGLTPNTLYYYSAEATNSVGTSWPIASGSYITLSSGIQTQSAHRFSELIIIFVLFGICICAIGIWYFLHKRHLPL